MANVILSCDKTKQNHLKGRTLKIHGTEKAIETLWEQKNVFLFAINFLVDFSGAAPHSYKKFPMKAK